MAWYRLRRLPQAPSRWYLTGFLVPTDADEGQRFDPNSRIGCRPAFFDYLWAPLMADTPRSQFASAKLAKSAVAKLKVVIHSACHIVPRFGIEASDEQ